MKQIVLASASPRRKTILDMAGIPNEVIVSPLDEDSFRNETLSPEELVKSLSYKKAVSVVERLTQPAIVIAADTVVYVNEEILGKPKDHQEAFSMLKKLQSRGHTVYTGVTIIDKGFTKLNFTHVTFMDEARVYMRALTDEEIDNYINTGEPFDKAGGYAIQEKGALLIERIKGDFYTVMGLPLVRVYLAMAGMGVDMGNLWRTNNKEVGLLIKDHRGFIEDEFELDDLRKKTLRQRDIRYIERFQKPVRAVYVLVVLLVCLLAYYAFNLIDEAIESWRTNRLFQQGQGAYPETLLTDKPAADTQSEWVYI